MNKLEELYNQYPPISEKEIHQVQGLWADALLEIGKAYRSNEDYLKKVTEMVDNLYGYDYGSVLFKPTNASDRQFRDTKKSAISYFVGGKVEEDRGFALKPWIRVRFEDDRHIAIIEDVAIVMGNYYFTDELSDVEKKVEYTFGYKRVGKNGKLVIFLHHSSLPYIRED